MADQDDQIGVATDVQWDDSFFCERLLDYFKLSRHVEGNQSLESLREIVKTPLVENDEPLKKTIQQLLQLTPNEYSSLNLWFEANEAWRWNEEEIREAVDSLRLISLLLKLLSPLAPSFESFLSLRKMRMYGNIDFKVGPWIEEDAGVRVMVGEPPNDEFRTVQKLDSNKDEKKGLPGNEKAILQRILMKELNEYKGKNFCNEASGAQNIVWLVNHNKKSFCMWPQAVVALEHCAPATQDCLCQWSEQILRGLTFLHEKHNIVHRDIQPKNILIREDQTAMICDFETATQCVGDDYKHYDGPGDEPSARIGFAPPEYGKKPFLYSFGTDVWGFCATMSFAFTGLGHRWDKRFYRHIDNLDLFHDTELTKKLRTVLLSQKEYPPYFHIGRPTLRELRAGWPQEATEFRAKKK